MHNSPEAGFSRSPNSLTVEELKDFNKTSIREALTEAGFVAEGDVVSEEDFSAIQTRAEVLAQESAQPISATTALLRAYVDRMQLLHKLGNETMKQISNEALKAILYTKTGEQYSDEELHMFRGSPLPLNEWVEGREGAKETLH